MLLTILKGQTMFSRKNRTPSSRSSTQRNNLHFESLEDRRLLAADFLLDGSLLTIDTDSANDVIRVDIENPFFDFSFLRVEYGHQTTDHDLVVDGYRFYAFSSVDSIHFFGNARNDLFINNTSIDSIAHGGGGLDVLWGGSGYDQLYGEMGTI